MLNIRERSNEELAVLQHGEKVFHDALGLVKQGETRFHVTDPAGVVPDYDLEYTENMMMFPDQVRGLIIKMTNGGAVYASFLDYDETDTDNICIRFLEQFEKIEIEAADEYSIVVARIALAHTKVPVYTADERLKWFVEDGERLHLVEGFASERDHRAIRIIEGPFEMGYTKRDWTYLSSVAAFQNLFFWQSFTAGQNGPFSYVEVVLSRITGIGGILSIMSMIGRASASRGLSAYLQPGCTRYPEELLCRYFHINPKPADAVKENTIVIADLAVLTTSWFCCQYPANFDESVLEDRFADEMKEYANAILGDKKVLGVLARGTDYVTMDLGADRRHATADQMISAIKEWMEEYGYEKIFLATEDKDNFDRIREAFPGKVIAISQERHSVSEMKKKNSSLIYEFEQKLNTGTAYLDALEDTTVNYFYALYILARCDAFLCSGQCNGWDTVRSLNAGRFERERKLMVYVEGDPATEKWKEIRPVGAGMFARGTYPTGKAFFMTYRFDLNERVSLNAIKEAWEKTTKVYPYLTYAVGTRAGRLIFLENPLPFVIKETAEVVEPFERSGNFHTVTFCYLGKTLWVYADHVPFDGTGFRYVLETFFYHYYCSLDGRSYDAPEGIFTEKDGAAPGTEVDAYQMAEAIDPASMMKNLSDSSSFVPKETVQDELFAAKANCRAYSISVDSKELMDYAKSVKGSPMSVLAVFCAKAMERVCPENNLPVSIMAPVSVRKVMGNTTSLLHQVVHAPYSFKAEDLKGLDDESLNAGYRNLLKGFSSEQNIRMLCGVYRGICEGYAKAFGAGALDNIILEQRAKSRVTTLVSYLGTLRTGEYGNRIRMTAYHAMPEKGIMLQATEVGHSFYIDWYQGFGEDKYVKAMRDLMVEAGMESTFMERVE